MPTNSRSMNRHSIANTVRISTVARTLFSAAAIAAATLPGLADAPSAAPPGSLEGFIYTTVPLGLQTRGYLEIVPQALLLSALLFYWVRHPGKAWLNWSLGLAYAICALLPILGLLAPKR